MFRAMRFRCTVASPSRARPGQRAQMRARSREPPNPPVATSSRSPRAGAPVTTRSARTWRGTTSRRACATSASTRRTNPATSSCRASRRAPSRTAGRCRAGSSRWARASAWQGPGQLGLALQGRGSDGAVAAQRDADCHRALGPGSRRPRRRDREHLDRGRHHRRADRRPEDRWPSSRAGCGSRVASRATRCSTPCRRSVAATPSARCAARSTTSTATTSNGSPIPTGREHVYCFAYYVTPPPGSASVTIRKQVSSPPKATKTFEFEGNISYTETRTFNLNVVNGNTPSTTFYRAETRPGDPAWTFRENVPSGWLKPQISCTSQKGSTVTVSRATASVSILPLVAGDAVDCLFVNEQNVEDGTLVLSKRTLGRGGTFPMTVQRVGGGAPITAVATTTRSGEVADAVPSPIKLSPGKYTVSEQLPEVSGGVWRLAGINCDATNHPGPSVTVEINADRGSACVFENVFVPDGSITIEKATRGDVGTFGFLIAGQGDPVREYEQRATTSREDEFVTATGNSTRRLALGTYVIRETSTAPDAGGRWALESVVCDGQLEPFAQGKVTVELTAERPDLTCRFVNVLLPVVPLPDPRPTPEPVPPSPLPAPAPSEQSADLVVTKRPLVRAVRVGQLAPFEITVRNAGEATAEHVALVDRPRRGGQIATASSSQGSCGQRALLACSLGTLAPGESATVRVRVRATGGPVVLNTSVAGSSTARAAARQQLRERAGGDRGRGRRARPLPLRRRPRIPRRPGRGLLTAALRFESRRVLDSPPDGARGPHTLRPTRERGASLRPLARIRPLPPGTGGHRGRELLDRDPTAERHRRAAHGARAQRLDPGHADPLRPHARQADEVDPRHRPRRDRHPDAGRAAARDRGHQPRGDRPRGVRRARLALARAVRQHDHRPVQAARRVLRLRRGALHARRVLRPRRPEGLRRAVREGPDLPRQLPRQLGSGLAVGDLGPRGRGPRGHGHPLLRRLSAGLAATGRSRSRPSARRRCSATPRSPCTPTTTATRGWWGRPRSCRSSAAA